MSCHSPGSYSGSGLAIGLIEIKLKDGIARSFVLSGVVWVMGMLLGIIR